jgi:hypothetical protein
MDRWSRKKKYTSIVDYVEAEENLSFDDVKRISPAWYLEQLQHNATRLKREMREQMPKVIRRERGNPRYKLIYEDDKIIGRYPSL